jgi:hypothetical protein
MRGNRGSIISSSTGEALFDSAVIKDLQEANTIQNIYFSVGCPLLWMSPAVAPLALNLCTLLKLIKNVYNYYCLNFFVLQETFKSKQKLKAGNCFVVIIPRALGCMRYRYSGWVITFQTVRSTFICAKQKKS